MLIFLQNILALRYLKIKVPEAEEYLGSINDGSETVAMFLNNKDSDTFEIEDVDRSTGKIFKSNSNKSICLTVKFDNANENPRTEKNESKNNSDEIYKLTYGLLDPQNIKDKQVLNIENEDSDLEDVEDKKDEKITPRKYYKLLFGHLCATKKENNTVLFEKCSKELGKSQRFELVDVDKPELENVKLEPILKRLLKAFK